MNSTQYTQHTPHRPAATRRAARAAVAVAATALLLPAAGAVAAPPTSTVQASTVQVSVASHRQDTSIPLPGASSAEGIAKGRGSTFYAGDLGRGDIFRGDVRDGTAELFIDAPEGRAAVGLKADARNDLLFVAGGATGQAYVYDTRTGDDVAVFQLATGDAFINDVTLTRDGAYFTDSRSAALYFVPADDRQLGEPRTIALSGPAAAVTPGFNLNGITSVDRGRTLIVAHSANQALYTVDPETGGSAVIDTGALPNVDGILAKGDTVYAVQNRSNQVSRINLSRDLSGGEVEDVITSPLFDVPTTVALFGNTLALANAKFGAVDPDGYEVVTVSAR
ncbi:SMP-30/gluconolactonase/LRE family protein [Arthrobacter sp. MDT1-65]